ncbi:MAG: KPN_02809 family neutral zinc metallopeptidase [Acidimicrobiales bacterium]
MKWKRGVGRDQIEDRRGEGGGGLSFPLPGGRRQRGPRLPIPIPGGKAGCGGTVGTLVLLLAVFLLMSGNVPGCEGGFSALPEGSPAPDDDRDEFVGFVVDDIQDEWAEILPDQTGTDYDETVLVLFDGEGTQSGCGFATSAVGPFYCPLDAKVFIDLGFFDELAARFGAPGDFAQAYVTAHEFGHHVQNILGTSDDVRSEQQANPSEANELSVRLELQADCYAGIWAHTAFSDELLESGDLEEGIAAAEAVGDDRIQEQTQGQINPETWTHGSSEMRARWFRTGFDSGQVDDCDTFSSAADVGP